MRKWWGVLVGSALAIAPGSARAQLAWDSPMLMPPQVGEGIGVFLMDAAYGRLGVMGTYHSDLWNFGARAGLAEGRSGDLGLFGGIDFHGLITRSTDEFPLDIDWVFGAGLGIDHGVLVSLPLGLTVGHTFPTQDATFLPYITPRVILDGCIDCDRFSDDDNVDLDFAVDVGLDLRFDPRFLIRFGVTVNREAVAIGVVF
jgi:hypothetical protein